MSRKSLRPLKKKPQELNFTKIRRSKKIRLKKYLIEQKPYNLLPQIEKKK